MPATALRTERYRLKADPKIRGPREKPSLRSIEARNALVEKNQRLVYKIARQRFRSELSFRNLGLSYSDLAQEGMLGLIRAAELFDETMGHQFSTYACRWIKAKIKRLIEGGHLIHVPVRLLDGTKNVNPKRRAEAERVLKVQSLTLHEEGKEEQMEIPVWPSDPDLGPVLDVHAVRDALKGVSPLYRQCVEDVYYQGKSTEVIGREHGISRQAVSLRVQSGLQQLRKELNRRCARWRTASA